MVAAYYLMIKINVFVVVGDEPMIASSNLAKVLFGKIYFKNVSERNLLKYCMVMQSNLRTLTITLVF
jgi:hypothetical protein